MRDANFRALPKLRDSLSYVYIEHAKLDRGTQAVAVYDKEGETEIPVSSLSLLMLGPGTSITHEAIKTLADSGCLTVWCGEHGVRYYAHGIGETRKSGHIERQARIWADDDLHMKVVRAMYEKRLGEKTRTDYTLEQLRGMEGVRVRESYAQTSRETGIEWKGRNYNRGNWRTADDINRAISAANSCLYGICHSAIVSVGYSAALGFIHRGKQLSFVYDIADLYKADISIPVAFHTVKQGPGKLESEVRKSCRDCFRESGLLKRIVSDIDNLFNRAESVTPENSPDSDQVWDENEDPSKPSSYWNPDEEHRGDES